MIPRAPSADHPDPTRPEGGGGRGAGSGSGGGGTTFFDFNDGACEIPYEGVLEFFFIDAAEEHKVPPAAYAEVRGNVGALLLKRGDLAEAAAELEASIALRDLATTRCNLAIIRIRQSDAAGAREHARAALRLGDESDSRTGTVARRILADVEVLEDQAK